MKRWIVPFALAFLVALPAYAQLPPPAGIRERAREEIRENVQEEVRAARERMQEEVRNMREQEREAATQAREQIREQVRAFQPFTPEQVEQFEAQRETFRKALEERREEFKSAIEAKREEVKAQVEAKRAELKTKLQVLRDDRRQQIVERIYVNVNELNTRMTKHFLEVLGNIEKVLERVESRADKAAANGLDVAAVRTAIGNAEAKIAASRAAVEAQAAKAYTVTVVGSSTLKSDVAAVRDALRNDLTAVRETVRAAHDAVRLSAVTLAQIPRIDEVEVKATSTED